MRKNKKIEVRLGVKLTKKNLMMSMLKDEHTKQEAFILGFDLAIDLVIKNLRIKVVDDQTENVVEYLEPEGFLDLMDETYSIDIENILKLKE